MLAPTPPGAPEPTPPTIYTTSWCGYCARLKYTLDAAEVLYLEVDIEAVPAAADIVTAANNGNRTVPTVVYADGTTMTNPGAGPVQAKLAELAAA